MTAIRGDHGGWIRLADVWPSIDKLYGIQARHSAGWFDPDSTLGEVLRTGSIRAHGLNSSLVRVLIKIESGNSAPAVDSYLGTIKLTETTSGNGAIMSFKQTRTYYEVEVNEADLEAYCRVILRPPNRLAILELPEALSPPPMKRKAGKRERAEAMARVVFPDGVPEHYPQKQALHEVLVRLEAEEKKDPTLAKVSSDTVRRALGFRV